MFKDCLSALFEFLIGTGQFFLFVDFTSLNWMRKEAITRILHSNHTEIEKLLQLLQEVNVMEKVLCIAVEVHQNPIVISFHVVLLLLLHFFNRLLFFFVNHNAFGSRCQLLKRIHTLLVGLSPFDVNTWDL